MLHSRLNCFLLVLRDDLLGPLQRQAAVFLRVRHDDLRSHYVLFLEIQLSLIGIYTPTNHPFLSSRWTLLARSATCSWRMCASFFGVACLSFFSCASSSFRVGFVSLFFKAV